MRRSSATAFLFTLSGAVCNATPAAKPAVLAAGPVEVRVRRDSGDNNLVARQISGVTARVTATVYACACSGTTKTITAGGGALATPIVYTQPTTITTTSSYCFFAGLCFPKPPTTITTSVAVTQLTADLATVTGCGPGNAFCPALPAASTAVPTTATTLRSSTTTRPASSTAAPAGAVQTLNVSGMTYTNAMLQAHNVHRANHSVSNLVWDDGLAATAAKIAASCVYAHDTATDGGGYGQNIGAGASGNAAAILVGNLMYNGEINLYPGPYGNDNPPLDNFSAWGHYTQIVWAETTNVGCYTQYCPNGLANTGTGVQPYFTVCNYSPPGNFVGEFSQVKAPQGGATVVIVAS